MSKKKKVFHLVLFFSVLVVALFVSFLLTQYVIGNDSSKVLIQDYGHISIIFISFIAGINALIPIPAATFVPVFTAGGISLPMIIFLLVVGTMLANLISFAIGQYGGNITKTHYPHIQKKLVRIYRTQKKWLSVFVFAFAAFIPFPDEVYLIPLGIVGVKLKQFIIPLVLGTICYQTIAAFGVYNVFKYFLV
jgi:membrane protein DedA with SNARE-associated domain